MYNPNILGFLEDKGPLIIPLKKAKQIYGQMPSDYKFVSKKDGRRNKASLNLSIGKLITEKFKKRETNLKEIVYDFFNQWHRDYDKEFGIKIAPFLNLNNPILVKKIIKDNLLELGKISQLDLRDYLEKNQLIRKDILNSIDDQNLSITSEKILIRKFKQIEVSYKIELIRKSLAKIRANRIIKKIETFTSFKITNADFKILNIYADEITKELCQLSHHIEITEANNLCYIKENGVEFEFATRDISYLVLGKKTGDCTADKSQFQADSDIENIYWTVFPWILDRNYQILKVYYNGDFVMKVHLLPLFVIKENGDGIIILAIDAIETVRAFRDDIQGHGKDGLLNQKLHIFNQVIQKVREIADSMGIFHVYAEKFSNTKWVREMLDMFPEIFLDVNNIIKLDELEDIFSLSQDLFSEIQKIPPNEIFMEVQMKNTSLIPQISNRISDVKPFAIIYGNPSDGILMKKVIGV